MRIVELWCCEESEVECEKYGMWLMGGKRCAEEDDDDVEDWRGKENG